MKKNRKQLLLIELIVYIALLALCLIAGEYVSIAPVPGEIVSYAIPLVGVQILSGGTIAWGFLLAALYIKHGAVTGWERLKPFCVAFTGAWFVYPGIFFFENIFQWFSINAIVNVYAILGLVIALIILGLAIIYLIASRRTNNKKLFMAVFALVGMLLFAASTITVI